MASNTIWGKIVVGHVLDCNKKELQRLLQQYDPQLYLEWNPKKLSGRGVWELRRKPDTKTAIYAGKYDGNNLYKVDYIESNLVHHVMDIEYLSYAVIDQIKAMDTWEKHNYGLDTYHDSIDTKQALDRKRNRDEMLYQLKSNRKYLQIFKEAVTSGYRPQDFFSGIYDPNHEQSVFNKKL